MLTNYFNIHWVPGILLDVSWKKNKNKKYTAPTSQKPMAKWEWQSMQEHLQFWIAGWGTKVNIWEEVMLWLVLNQIKEFTRELDEKGRSLVGAWAKTLRHERIQNRLEHQWLWKWWERTREAGEGQVQKGCVCHTKETSIIKAFSYKWYDGVQCETEFEIPYPNNMPRVTLL